MTVSA